jgi:hypothetical protein
MRIISAFFSLIIGFLFTSAVLAADVNVDSSIVGKPLLVKTTGSLSSKTATLGQKFEVEVAEDVVGDTGVIVPAGTKGEGTVIFVRKKGGGGKTGALDLRIDHLILNDQKLKLRAQNVSRGKDKKNAALGMQVAFGLLGALSVQGEEINLAPGTVINAEFAEEIHKTHVEPSSANEGPILETEITEKSLSNEHL